MTRPRGRLPDPPDVVARRVGLHLHPLAKALRASASSLPLRTTNRAFLPVEKGGPGVLDQHDVGACEGFAHAETGTLYLASQGLSQGLISPTALYVGGLLIDRRVLAGGALTPVTDTGTTASSILAAWSTFGARLAKDDTQYPCQRVTLYTNPSDDNSTLVLPSVETLYADSPYRFDGAYFITAVGPHRLLDALTVLASGRTLTNAIPASGDDFQGYSGGVLGALSGPIDHANTILDYEWLGAQADWDTFCGALRNSDLSTVTQLSPSLNFHCLNSWGETWGEGDSVAGAVGGLYRANTDYFNQAEDLCVVAISAIK